MSLYPNCCGSSVGSNLGWPGGETFLWTTQEDVIVVLQQERKSSDAQHGACNVQRCLLGCDGDTIKVLPHAPLCFRMTRPRFRPLAVRTRAPDAFDLEGSGLCLREYGTYMRHTDCGRDSQARGLVCPAKRS